MMVRWERDACLLPRKERMVNTLYRVFSLAAALLFAASPVLAAEIWSVDSYKLTDVSAMSEPVAAAWVGKQAQIGETSIAFDGKSCLIKTRTHEVDAASFITTRVGVRPETVGITERDINLVETGCTIPGFETIISLGDDKLALLYRGVFFFLSRQSVTPKQAARRIAVSRKLLQKPFPEAGITLKYPEGTALVSPHSDHKLPGVSMWIATEKVSALDNSGAPLTRKEAERDQEALKHGGFGEDIGNAVPGSKKAIPLKSGGYAKTYAVLSRYEACDVTCLLTAVIYNQGYRVEISVAANASAIRDENPDYFTRAECGEHQHWDHRRNAADIFYRDLATGRLGGLAGTWFQTFHTVLTHLGVAEAQPLAAKAEADKIFLDSDQAVCRTIPAAVYAKEYPGYALVLDRTYSLKLPTLGQVCFLTLENKKSQTFAVASQGKILSNLRPASTNHWTVRDLAFEDLDADGLPEIIALMVDKGPDGESYAENEVYWSRKAANGERWEPDTRFTREVRNLNDMGRVLQRLKSMLASALKDGDKGIELVGQIVEEGVYLTFVPQQESKDIVYNVAKLPPSLDADYDDILQRELSIRARVLRSETAQGVTTLHIELLEYKIL